MALLAHLAASPDQVSIHNLMNTAQRAYAGLPDGQLLLNRYSNAVAWIENRGLVGRTGYDPSGSWRRLTALGRELAADSAALTRMWATERLAGNIDPTLEAKVRPMFNAGDFETACFAAMKEVEVAVRAAGGFDNPMVGVLLSRQAFSRDGGSLTDDKAEPGERVAAMELSAGAIGAFQNPSSHRTVDFEDPVEAAEIVQLADLLLRMVRRVEARNATRRYGRYNCISRRTRHILQGPGGVCSPARHGWCRR